MTRKQAEKIADEIRKLAYAAGKGSREWTRVEVDITPNLAEKIDESRGQVVGCMPMGWRLAGEVGSLRLTVIRALALLLAVSLAACSSPTAPTSPRPYPIRPTPIACDSCSAPTVRP